MIFTYYVYNTFFSSYSKYLIWFEDAVSTDITPVQGNRRQGQRGVQCIMVFIQKTGNFIRKDGKHCILAHFTCIAMQNRFPSQSMVSQVVTDFKPNMYNIICVHFLQFEPVCCQMQWILFQWLQTQTFHTVTVKTWTRVASKALVCDNHVST